MMAISDLYQKSSNHDVLTLYIRPDTPIQKVLNLLKREEPIINNIKSRTTREGIKSAMQNLKTFLLRAQPSKNGYVIVSGPSGLAFTTEVLVSLDKYSCGNEFYSGPLEEALATRLYPIGIITLDTKEATLARITNRVELLESMTSGIAGKTQKGGQSQRRYERERDMAIAAWFKRIAETAKLFVEAYPVEELIVSGCGMTKNDFLDTKYLDYRLKAKVTIVIDTQYTDEHGIRETLHKALPQLQKNAYAKEVQVIEDVFAALGKNIDSIVYGREEIIQKLPSIKKIIKIEEVADVPCSIETITLHFQGEHYEKLKSIGGIVGLR